MGVRNRPTESIDDLLRHEFSTPEELATILVVVANTRSTMVRC
jgi:hypothetical protein